MALLSSKLPPIPDDNPPLINTLLAHLGDYRNLLRVLIVDTRVAIAQANADGVVQNLTTMAALARHTGESFGAISALVAISIQARTIDTALEVLSQDLAITSSQLHEIDAALARFDSRDTVKHALHTERLMFTDLVQRTFTLEEDGNGVLTPAIGEFTNNIAMLNDLQADPQEELLGAIIVSRSADRLDTIAEHDRIVDLCDAAVYAEARDPESWRFDHEIDRLSDDKSWRFAMVGVFMPGVDRLIHSLHESRMQTAAARILIAAELHRRETGTWPSSLDDLDSDLLDILPRDPFTGDHLIYRLRDAEPLIYSPGADSDDDGAVPIENGPHRAILWLDPQRPDPPDGDWILYPPN